MNSLRFALPTFLTLLITGLFSLHASADTTRWDVRAAGALGDGVADDTTLFQKLLDEAGQAGGGIVHVSAGTYRIAGRLSIPANVTLQGIYRSAPNSAQGGSVLQAFAGRGKPDEAAFITLAGHNAVVAGLAIVYPEWKVDDVPPIPYPPCISNAPGRDNTAVIDTLLLNPYEGIRLVKAGRHLVRNVTGYPIWRGLHVDQCYDIGRVENVHFWPFGLTYRQDDPYCEWINKNGTAFSFQRTDWEYVSNTFCFGYGIGYHFSESEHGSANGNFSGIGADSCQRSVFIEQSQTQGLAITNGEFVGRWGSKDSICVEIGPENKGRVGLENCAFWGPIDRCIWMRSPFSQMTANNCTFINWDRGGQGSAAIQIDAGRAIVQGCFFGEDSLHVKIAEAVRSALLTTNQAAGGFRVENAAGRRTQTAWNEEDPVEWTDAARLHYRIQVGEDGDGRYVLGWHGPEHPQRWTQGRSRLRLPAQAEQPYTLVLRGHFPKAAMDEDSGLYLGDVRLATFPEKDTLRVELPPTSKDSYLLELRCKGWVPKEQDSKSKDTRRLGVRIESILLRAESDNPAPAKIFNANTGVWEKSEVEK